MRSVMNSCIQFSAFVFALSSAAIAHQARVIFAADVNVASVDTGAIIRNMNQILSSSNCNTAEVSLGFVRRFENLNARGESIAVESMRDQFKQSLRDNNGNILVLRELAACGRDEHNTSVLGCAGRGTVLTVELAYDDRGRFDPRATAQIWLHELGHSQNLMWGRLGIGNPHSSEIDELMFESASGGEIITSEQCQDFSSTNQTFSPIQIDSPTPGAIVLAAGTEENSEEGVSETIATISDNPFQIIRRPWSDGVPYETLDGLTDQEGLLDEARGIVLDPEEVVHWPNALAVLGAYGPRSEIEFVKWVLSRSITPAEGLEEFYGKGKAAAIGALGTLAARHRDRDATAFLQLVAASVVDAESVEDLNDDATISNEIDLRNTGRYALGDTKYQALIALSAASGAIDQEGDADAPSSVAAALTGDEDSELGELFTMLSGPRPFGEVFSAEEMAAQAAIVERVGESTGINPLLVGSLPGIVKAYREAPDIDAMIRQTPQSDMQ